MYRVKYSDVILEELRSAAKTSTSIPDRLEELENNPFSRAIETGIEAIGDYYVNAGRYSLLIEIDKEQEIVAILSVRNRSYLYKVMTGQIAPAITP